MDGSAPKLRPTIRPYLRFKGASGKVWLPEQLLWRTEISAQAKLVYARLARYEGRTGSARPKLDTLAKQLGLSWSTTQRAIKELEAADLIKVKIRRGQHRPNVYMFLDHPWLHEKVPPDIEEEAGDDPSEDHVVPKEDPPGVDGKLPEEAGPWIEFEASQPVSEDVDSDPLEGLCEPVQVPTGGSLDEVRYPRAGFAKPTGGFLEAPDTHGRVSGEKSHNYEKSQMKRVTTGGAVAHAGIDAGAPAQTTPAGDPTDEDRPSKQGSAPLVVQRGLSIEEQPVGIYDTIDKLTKTAAAASAKTAKTEAEQTRKRAARAKQSVKNLRGGPGRIRVRPIEEMWRREMRAKFPDMDERDIGRWFLPYEATNDEGEKGTAWRGLKEVGIVAEMIKRFDEGRVAQYLRWSVQNWEKIQQRFKNPPRFPTVNWLATLAATLLPEATATAVAADVQAEADQWLRDHPEADELPPTLQARLTAAFGRSK